MILGEKVKELRKAKGWSQTDLANAAGVKQPTIVSIERGRQRTSKYSIKIADALGVNVREVDPDYIFGPTPSQLDADTAGLAYEVMLENLRPDLSQEGRQGSATVFLDLARTVLDGDTDESRVQQLRDRLLQIYADHFVNRKHQ